MHLRHRWTIHLPALPSEDEAGRFPWDPSRTFKNSHKMFTFEECFIGNRKDDTAWCKKTGTTKHSCCGSGGVCAWAGVRTKFIAVQWQQECLCFIQWTRQHHDWFELLQCRQSLLGIEWCPSLNSCSVIRACTLVSGTSGSNLCDGDNACSCWWQWVEPLFRAPATSRMLIARLVRWRTAEKQGFQVWDNTRPLFRVHSK